MRFLKYALLTALMGWAMPTQARLIESANSARKSVPQSNAVKTKAPPVSSVTSWSALQEKATETLARFTSFFSKPEAPPAKIERSTAAERTQVVEASPKPEPTREQKELSKVLEVTKQIVEKSNIIEVASPGREATTPLPKTAKGVPQFDLFKTEKRKDKETGEFKTVKIAVKDIPRIDIGVERSVTATEFLPLDHLVPLPSVKKQNPLATPQIYSQKKILEIQKAPITAVVRAKNPKRGNFELGQIVTSKKIADVALEMKEILTLQELKPYTDIAADELTMIVAMAYYNQNKCHLVSGLLTKLADRTKYHEEANYYLGVCAHQMGFHSEAVSRLLKVISKESNDFTAGAITNIAENLPREYDQAVVSAIRKLKNKDYIEEKAKDNVNYIFARAAHESQRFSEAAEYAEKVSEKSEHYMNARYLYSIALFAQKKVNQAAEGLISLRDWMQKKNKDDKNIQALIAVNLARMLFTQSRFQPAYDEYLKVPKDHPLWVQALVEQGWAQLSLNDAEGAIGNMYSLHSPYFRSVFMPESWVVRTIGYIDICQYGDAYRTLAKLEDLHGQWSQKIGAYVQTHKGPQNHYNTVKNYLRGKSNVDVDGLPHQVIREIARQRGFLNAQNTLNTLEDEIAQYNFIYKMVRQDQQQVDVRITKTRQRLAETKANLIKAKAQSALVKFVNEWNAQRRLDENLIELYLFQKEMLEQSRKGFIDMRQLAFTRIESEKAKQRGVAGKELISHLNDINKRISQIVEGNEFLRYEIFSGSGENIRYQVSGGATAKANRIPANVKPEKILNWEFDGEYWEDEIGSYRSSLKNNCPKSSRVGQTIDSTVKRTAAKNEDK